MVENEVLEFYILGVGYFLLLTTSGFWAVNVRVEERCRQKSLKPRHRDHEAKLVEHLYRTLKSRIVELVGFGRRRQVWSLVVALHRMSRGFIEECWKMGSTLLSRKW